MSYVTIEEFGGHSVDRATKILAGIPGGAQKAIQSAMPRAVSHLQKQSGERVRERYAISQANLRANETIKVDYQMGQGVKATVKFAGAKIPLYRFDGASPKSPAVDKSKLVSALVSGGWKKVHPGKAASGHQLVGTSPTTFENAFVATMSSGHTGIFERVGDKLDELMGSSVAQMVGNDEVVNKLAEDTSKKFEERMEHEITRLLSGIGGK